MPPLPKSTLPAMSILASVRCFFTDMGKREVHQLPSWVGSVGGAGGAGATGAGITSGVAAGVCGVPGTSSAWATLPRVDIAIAAHTTKVVVRAGRSRPLGRSDHMCYIITRRGPARSNRGSFPRSRPVHSLLSLRGTLAPAPIQDFPAFPKPPV